ncbi:MAG: Hsp70 family protein [Pirellulaceae bacterium]
MTSAFDPLIDRLPARYVVGIDLGTTNSAVAYVDTHESPWQIRVLLIPQLVAPGVVEARDTLPSFHYEAAAGETPDGALRLPWDRVDQDRVDPTTAVGIYARDHGGRNPGRLITSAKSWLCHSGVDRTADLLPWHGVSGVERLSPIEVSARILRHVRAAWNASFPAAPLADQDIVLTLPASFDEIARELTVEAAARAELPRVMLLEEPQAAFYAWVYKHAHDWHALVESGQTILVCDIGGGTSDFTLIRVRASQAETQSSASAAASAQASPEQRIQFHRIAVGNHLILGGDNLDLALARHLEQQLAHGGQLPSAQWDVLVRICQRVKEELLGEQAAERLTVNLPSLGARLIGGGLQVEVTREAVRDLLVEGFLPRVSLSDKPLSRQSGFQEFGLPYAADPAITRYLAAFLTAHRETLGEDGAAPHQPTGIRPDIVLFNGGFFASPVLRERLIELITHWYRTAQQPDWVPLILDNDRLDLAVARGAAYFGMVRRGAGVRITANLARSYYIGVESDQPSAVCLVPGSAEPGQTIEMPDRLFRLLISEPVEFPLWVSSLRLTDRPGELVAIDREQMSPLPPIRTVLRTRSRRETGTISVRLHARLTDIGTMELWCTAADRDRSWRLQFDIRSATETDVAAQRSAGEAEGILDEATWDRCEQGLAGVFGPQGKDRPEGLVKRLTEALQSARQQWPTPLLRRIWESLMDLESGRRKGVEHEARWVNLLGFALRPGYGLAVDDWRVAETWRTVQGKLVHASPAVRSEAIILWRRVAGGLSRGQQQALADPLLSSIRSLHHRFTAGTTRGDDAPLRPNELAEIWRLLGSLELLDVTRKIELGNILVALLPKRKLANLHGPMIWALGRLGQRVPVYGPLNTVVPSDTAERWLDALLSYAAADPATGSLAVMQIARRTDDRYRDVGDKCRRRVVTWLEDEQAPPHLTQLVRDGGHLDMEEQRQVFGESLPKGLRLE